MKRSWYGKSSLEQRTRSVDFNVNFVCTEKVFVYVAFCVGTNAVRAHFFWFILSLFSIPRTKSASVKETMMLLTVSVFTGFQRPKTGMISN